MLIKDLLFRRNKVREAAYQRTKFDWNRFIKFKRNQLDRLNNEFEDVNKRLDNAMKNGSEPYYISLYEKEKEQILNKLRRQRQILFKCELIDSDINSGNYKCRYEKEDGKTVCVFVFKGRYKAEWRGNARLKMKG